MTRSKDSRPVLGYALDNLQGVEFIESASIIAEDLVYRSKIGEKAYNTRLMTFNGRDPLIDLYEELLDAYMYLMQLEMEHEHTAPVFRLPDYISDSILSCLDSIVKHKALSGFDALGLLSMDTIQPDPHSNEGGNQ